MPPRGSEGLDFTPVLTHYLFLFTTILAVVRISLHFSLSLNLSLTPPFYQVGWFVAFIGQAATTARSTSSIFPFPFRTLTASSACAVGRGEVGVLWFAIFLQLFLIIGVIYTLASDSVAMNRLQIATFGAVAIVFAVTGANAGIFFGPPELNAMGAGWLILAIVDILWVLYFTAEEDSLTYYLFNVLGNGGLSSPSRRRRRQPSVHNMGIGPNTNGGYGSGVGYTSPTGGIGPGTYDTKLNGSFGGAAAGGPIRSQNSLNASSFADGNAPARSLNGPISSGTPQATPGLGASALPGDTSGGVNSPLMSAGNAGVGAGGGPGLPEDVSSGGGTDNFTYKAKALYACTHISFYDNSCCKTRADCYVC